MHEVHSTRLCVWNHYKNMQLSKLRGCKTYLPNYAVAVQRKLHLQCTVFSYIYIYIYMLDGPLGSILHPTGSSRYMATLDT